MRWGAMIAGSHPRACVLGIASPFQAGELTDPALKKLVWMHPVLADDQIWSVHTTCSFSCLAPKVLGHYGAPGQSRAQFGASTRRSDAPQAKTQHQRPMPELLTASKNLSIPTSDAPIASSIQFKVLLQAYTWRQPRSVPIQPVSHVLSAGELTSCSCKKYALIIQST